MKQEIRQTPPNKKPYERPELVRVHVDPRQDLIAQCDLGAGCTPTESSG